MHPSNETIGVVGAGLGGLAAACTLAARGYRVIVFEANRWLGGKAAVLQREGFTWDMGPTILTLPSVLRRVFSEAGRKLEDALDLVPLDPQWRSFFEDGSTLDLFADVTRMRRALHEFDGQAATADGYDRFMQHAHHLATISERFFFWRPIESLRDMFRPREAIAPAGLRDLLAMRFGRTVSANVRSHVAEPRVGQMLDHFTQYIGSAPDNSPAVLCGIASMQTSEGVWYPRGGIGEIARALTNLASELGVDFRTDTPIRRILQADNRVVGIETRAGQRVDLVAVVTNADAVRTHTDLLEGAASRNFLQRRKYEPACSGVVLYLGLDRRYPQLLHHNFVFSRDPAEEFQAIYRRGELAPDPTCYVCAPSVTDPRSAPAGGEALYVLVHTPYLRPEHDWQRLFPEYRRVILDKLARTAGLDDLEDRTVVEQALTPRDIHERYRVLKGAIYGLASHGRFFGAFKPGNRSRDLRGLYLAGGAAHPGPGMPMVLMSGWIAADTLDRDSIVPGHALQTPREPWTTVPK